MWGEIDAAAAKVLFKLAPFLEDGLYQQILDRDLPQLSGYTPVSSACICRRRMYIQLACNRLP